MTTLADREWGALLSLAVEAIDLLEPEEKDYARLALEANRCWVRFSGLDDSHVTLMLDECRLLTVHRLILARSNSNPQDN